MCKAKFDPPPPSRAVLMAGFTGEEVAGLLHAGCLIVCERRTSRHMATLLRDRGVGSLRHWVRGVYLITATHEGRATDDNDLIVAVTDARGPAEPVAVVAAADGPAGGAGAQRRLRDVWRAAERQ